MDFSRPASLSGWIHAANHATRFNPPGTLIVGGADPGLMAIFDCASGNTAVASGEPNRPPSRRLRSGLTRVLGRPDRQADAVMLTIAMIRHVSREGLQQGEAASTD